MRLALMMAAMAGFAQSETRCLPCHPAQTKSYASTGMARSVGPVSADTGTFKHGPSGTLFAVARSSAGIVHQMQRGGRSATYQPKWSIGSGTQGRSFIHQIQDALFQSPVSWYAQRRAFDVSPGFEADRNPDFYRPITSDCLFCHAGTVRARAGSQNRYVEPPFQPIGCERCHGDAAAHVAAPSRHNIVNPAHLEPARRDAVCEQCHLGGEARIPNPGKMFADFNPGARMEDIFSVYVRDDEKGLKVVSHSEQLALSRCFVESSPALWCATCHDPHATPAEPVTWYRGKCIGCHSDAKTATHEKKLGSDCANCHMPRLKVYDGGHTAFHDHRIGVPGRTQERGRSSGLRAWREPAAPWRNRNLGLAYISTGTKAGDSNELMRGHELLRSVPPDAAVDTARGLALLRMNKNAEAVAALRRAVGEEPANSVGRYNLAVALFAEGDSAGALRSLEQAIILEPLLEDAYVLAAEIEPRRAMYWKQRYLQLVPQRSVP